MRASSSDSPELLNMLEAIANSSTKKEMIGNVKNLRQSDLFNTRVAAWLEKHWLNHLEVG